MEDTLIVNALNAIMNGDLIGTKNFNKQPSMKAIDMHNRFIDPSVPTIARNVVDRALSELRQGNETPLEVTELEFELVTRIAKIRPNSTGHTPWFRVYMDNGNSKDIQIYDPWKQ